MHEPTVSRREEVIQDWLIARVSEWLAIDPGQILLDEPLANRGMSSVAAVSLAGELEDWLGIEVSPLLTYEYPTIQALSRHLARELESASAAGHAPPAEAGR